MENRGSVNAPRVLIIDKDSLLSAGLQSLLSQAEGVEVLAMTPTSEVEFVQTLERFRPSMIVVACPGPASTPPEVLDMLGGYPSVRLVAVSYDHNMVYVYDRAQVELQGLKDLLTLASAAPAASSIHRSMGKEAIQSAFSQHTLTELAEM